MTATIDNVKDGDRDLKIHLKSQVDNNNATLLESIDVSAQTWLHLR